MWFPFHARPATPNFDGRYVTLFARRYKSAKFTWRANTDSNNGQHFFSRCAFCTFEKNPFTSRPTSCRWRCSMIEMLALENPENQKMRWSNFDHRQRCCFFWKRRTASGFKKTNKLFLDNSLAIRFRVRAWIATSLNRRRQKIRPDPTLNLHKPHA